MDVYRALWRRRFLIAILTVATVATAYAVVSQQQKMYKSSALIRVQQRVSDPSQASQALGIAQHLAQTYAQIVVTDEIKNRVFRSLHGRVPREDISLSAEPLQDLELLYISATAPDPRAAAEVANAAPKVLRRFIAEKTPPGLRDEIETINPAGLPGAPVSPRVKTSLIIALLAGLVFNGALALLIEFMSDRLPEVDDLEAVTGRPVLATVPPLVFRSAGVTRLERRLGEPPDLAQPAEHPRPVPRAQPRRTSG